MQVHILLKTRSERNLYLLLSMGRIISRNLILKEHFKTYRGDLTCFAPESFNYIWHLSFKTQQLIVSVQVLGSISSCQTAYCTKTYIQKTFAQQRYYFSTHKHRSKYTPLHSPKNILQNISGYTTGRLWAIYNQGDVCDLSSLSGRLSQRMTDGRTDVIALHLKENRG